MNRICFLLFTLFFLNSNAQGILGVWKSIDDETGEAKSHVKVFEKDGKVYGKIIKVLNAKSKNPLCKACKGELKNTPIIGMQIIEELTKEDEVYEGGTILNPSNGKIYKCRLKLEDENTLQVRGYVAMFYKTQYWQRIN